MPKGECGYISKTPEHIPCYNIYVTLSMVVYSAAHNYLGITTLQVRYYAVRGYHMGLASQKLRKRRDGKKLK